MGDSQESAVSATEEEKQGFYDELVKTPITINLIYLDTTPKYYKLQ